MPLLPEGTVKCKHQIHRNNGAVAKVRVLVELRDTIRHLKTFRVISNEMPVLLLII